MKSKQTAYAGLMVVLMLLLGGMALPVRSASAAKVIAKEQLRGNDGGKL